MLLRDSLGHVNCHTTVLAQVTESLAHLQETLSTIQLASRIRRTQKRTKVLVYTFQTASAFHGVTINTHLSLPNSSPPHVLRLRGV